MSYDISLVDTVTGETLELDAPHHMRGGTYQVGGTMRAELNVTYNYGMHYRRVFDQLEQPHRAAPAWMHKAWMLEGSGSETTVRGIRTIYGLTGAESLPVLDRAIAALRNDIDPDYWKATEGNAKRALVQLRALALMRPDGLWSGD